MNCMEIVDSLMRILLFVVIFNCDARLKRMHAKKVHMVVETLKKHNLVDTYHYLNDEVQGEETKATFFMYRH